jgi:hypothetical protein
MVAITIHKLDIYAENMIKAVVRFDVNKSGTL